MRRTVLISSKFLELRKLSECFSFPRLNLVSTHSMSCEGDECGK